MHSIIDRTGQRFGKLFVVKAVIPSLGRKNRGGVWRCQCDCGKIKDIPGYTLLNIQSCGCIHLENTRKAGKLRRKYKEVTINAQYKGHRDQCKCNKNKKRIPLPRDIWEKIVFEPCHYCGQIDTRNIANTAFYVWTWGKASDEDKPKYDVQMNGVDRINSDIGYEPNNCVPCCIVCNRMKMALTVEQFVQHVNRVCEYTKTHLSDPISTIILNDPTTGK